LLSPWVRVPLMEAIRLSVLPLQTLFPVPWAVPHL